MSICNYDSYRKMVINKFLQSGLPVIVCGAGKFGISAAKALNSAGVTIIGFLEDDIYWKPDKKIFVRGQEYTCYNLEELEKLEVQYNICVGLIDYRNTERIRSLFPACRVVEYLDAVPSHSLEKEFFEKHRELMDEIYLNLCDEESRMVFNQFYKTRYSGDVTGLCKLVQDNGLLYDWELMELSKTDIVLDGGAYRGDTIKEIVDYLGTPPKFIYAFEPDKENAKQLQTFANDTRGLNYKIFQAGLYNSVSTQLA